MDPEEQLKVLWEEQANREVDELMKTENFVRAHQVMMGAFGYEKTSEFLIAMRQTWISVFVSGARFEHRRTESP